jgi:hypothetical protein
MARSLGVSKLLVLVNLMLVIRANSPPKRLLAPLFRQFPGEVRRIPLPRRWVNKALLVFLLIPWSCVRA